MSSIAIVGILLIISRRLPESLPCKQLRYASVLTHRESTPDVPVSRQLLRLRERAEYKSHRGPLPSLPRDVRKRPLARPRLCESGRWTQVALDECLSLAGYQSLSVCLAFERIASGELARMTSQGLLHATRSVAS